MQLEDYFDFLGPLDIRVKGTRIGINIILWDYLDHESSAEEIAKHYPTLTLEQIHATLTYYWHNQEQVSSYLQTLDEEYERRWQEQQLHPSPAFQRLRALAEARAAAAATSEL